MTRIEHGDEPATFIGLAGSLVPVNRQARCQIGQHHPHRYECGGCNDAECELSGPGSLLNCCLCGAPWPCETKQAHVQARKEGPSAASAPGAGARDA